MMDAKKCNECTNEVYIALPGHGKTLYLCKSCFEKIIGELKRSVKSIKPAPRLIGQQGEK